MSKRDERDFGALQEALLGKVFELADGKQVLVREEDVARQRYIDRQRKRRRKKGGNHG